MKGRLFTCDGHVYDLPVLLSWELVFTGSVPCDSFSVTFLYESGMAEALSRAAEFAALDDAGGTVLRAIVDEYSVDLGENGLTASVAGRGFAARLLDNESRPVTYQDVTLEEIVRNHAAPYGIRCAAAANVRASSVYTVAAGSSQWKALEGFCRTYGGFQPRFTQDGTLLAAPEKDSGKRILLSEKDPILSCTLREDHYGVLTEALVIDKTRNVSYSVQNPDLIKLGGRCRRVVYTPGQSTWAAMRYTGEYQIQRSKEDEKMVTASLPGSFLAYPGDMVSLDLPRMGIRETLRVAEAENTFSGEKGAVTTLTLKERG